MKMVIVAVLALAALAVAAPQNRADTQEPIKILRFESDQQPEGAYSFDFETENGITRQEKGELKQVVDEENKPQTVVVVRGSYSYTDTDGKPQTITYFADETGYHAEGDAIPKPARR